MTAHAHHHDPDEEEGVAKEDGENRNLTGIKINLIFLEERTVLDNMICGVWVIFAYPQSNPYCHIEHRAAWKMKQEIDNFEKQTNYRTAAKHDEVFVFDGYEWEGELDLQEQVQAFEEHPVEAG